jgi:ABC-type transport system involved in cytochrome c biogenesis permease subunit
MPRLLIILLALLSFTLVNSARADEFAQQVDLSRLQTLSIQHQQTLKTLDSYARQTLSAIAGKTRLDDQPALYVILDITFRPEQYVDRNIIRIKNVPLRKEFENHPTLSLEEKKRILEEGTISQRFFESAPVQELLSNAHASASWKADAINQLAFAYQQLRELTDADLKPLKVIAPATTNPEDHVWHDVNAVLGNMPSLSQMATSVGQRVPPALPNYGDRGVHLERTFKDLSALRQAWIDRNASDANTAIASLVATLPQVNPEVYPSAAKRKTEVIYNRLAKLTLPGAALYFVAFVCFLMSARAGTPRVRLWGLRFFFVGFVVHTIGIGIRWWLVEKSVGNWFESIPIKNQFESVLFSAWFGALIALILETRAARSIFGAAGSFVGWLSLTAIFATPYVFKREIGGEIGQAAGVLMSYWLYIHVTMVTAAYALIGMSFCLGVWWLVKYIADYNAIKDVSPRQLSADAAGGTEMLYDNASRTSVRPVVAADDDSGPIAYPGSAAALGFWSTLAAIFFFPQAKERKQVVRAKEKANAVDPGVRARSFLATLDLCNLVVLQLAFWVLGVGIVLGAIWADQSWGRPWGWDPKETFALVTWIVYLIIVHVRFITPDKALWTAILSIIGFAIMLFNWIGVNFFLVGLHSYA